MRLLIRYESVSVQHQNGHVFLGQVEMHIDTIVKSVIFNDLVAGFLHLVAPLVFLRLAFNHMAFLLNIYRLGLPILHKLFKLLRKQVLSVIIQLLKLVNTKQLVLDKARNGKSLIRMVNTLHKLGITREFVLNLLSIDVCHKLGLRLEIQCSHQLLQ